MLSVKRNELAGNIAGELHIGIQGPPGPQGPQGESVTITTQYAVSDRKDLPPSNWLDEIPEMSDSQPYLWIMITKTYTYGAAVADVGIIGYYTKSGSGGLSDTAANLLIKVLRNGVYSSDQSGNIDDLAAELGVKEATLESISAVYSGGNVAVGTNLTMLTGLTVTAHYSDGTSETVTGYTLMGEIAEGTNTITVSYGGKTTTFTVVGFIDEEPVPPPEVTLSSISVTYSGGDVAVGTELSELTGIVVTAAYSNGTSEAVTDYTLSGEIVEGSNTITVSYGGLTTTFTVTGVAQSTGTEVEMTQSGSHNWANGTEYSDGGTTAYTGAMPSQTGTMWLSEIFDKDTVVTIAILYGTTNANLRQYAACVDPDEVTVGSGASHNGNLYYVEQIGSASTSEYTATYTVRAGYRLAILNYNGGSPQSIRVTK